MRGSYCRQQTTACCVICFGAKNERKKVEKRVLLLPGADCQLYTSRLCEKVKWHLSFLNHAVRPKFIILPQFLTSSPILLRNQKWVINCWDAIKISGNLTSSGLLVLLRLRESRELTSASMESTDLVGGMVCCSGFLESRRESEHRAPWRNREVEPWWR